mmetsp:Transcript_5248/g.10887  ORF Transcript_5248/g.10887 Transcript_5248/m.10887 type:complete len:241 (+) Transcript_5248:111-833(+)
MRTRAACGAASEVAAGPEVSLLCLDVVDDIGRSRLADLDAGPLHHQQRLLDDVLGVQLRVVVLQIRVVVVVDPAIGQHHAPENRGRLAHAVQRAGLEELLLHLRCEAADGVLLDGDDRFVVGGEPADQLLVQGLHPPGVGDGRRDAELLQGVGGLEALAEAPAAAEDGERAVAALANDAALARLEEAGLVGHLEVPVGVAARVAQGRGQVVDLAYGVNHVHELLLVGRGADEHVRNAAHE